MVDLKAAQKDRRKGAEKVATMADWKDQLKASRLVVTKASISVETLAVWRAGWLDQWKAKQTGG